MPRLNLPEEDANLPFDAHPAGARRKKFPGPEGYLSWGQAAIFTKIPVFCKLS
jgi:hypothetical protein